MAENTEEIIITINSSGAVEELDKLRQSVDKVADSANKSPGGVVNLKQELRNLSRELATLDEGSEKFNEVSRRAGELKDRINAASEAINANAGPAIESMGNNVNLLKDRLMNADFEGVGASMKAIAGNIGSMKFGDVIKGIKDMGAGFAALGKALLLNPLFLIVTAVVGAGLAIKAMLDKQRENVDAANQAIDKSNAERHEKERIRIAAAGGDEQKLAQLRKQSAEADIQDTTKKIQNLEKQQRRAYGLSEEQEKELAKLREQLSKQRVDQEIAAIEMMNKLNSQRSSIEERMLQAGMSERDKQRRQIELQYQKEIESIQAVGGTQTDINNLLMLQEQDMGALNKKFADEDSQRRKQAAAERKRAAEERAKQEADAAAAAIKATEDAAAAAAKAEEERVAKAIAQQNLLRGIRNNELDEIEAAQAEIDNLRLTSQERELRAVQDAYFEKIEFARQNGLDTVALTEEEARLKKEINDKYRKEEEDAEKESAEKKKQLRAATVQAAADGINFLLTMNQSFEGKTDAQRKKSFERDKKLKIAQALINTYSAAMAAYEAGTKNPITTVFPAYPYIQAGLAVAAGLAQVSKISKTTYESPSVSGGGGPSPSGGGTGGGGGQTSPFAPTPNFQAPMMEQGKQDPFRAYVLNGDITREGEAQRRTQRQAEIG